MREINRIVVHCSDSAWADVEVIRGWHILSKDDGGKGFNDIGYHAVILNGFRKNSRLYVAEDDGRIEPGRPVTRPGAHAYGHNRRSLGVCMVGEMSFTPSQFDALEALLRVWRDWYQVDPAQIVGHRVLDSGKTCPNFDVTEWMEGRKI